MVLRGYGLITVGTFTRRTCAIPMATRWPPYVADSTNGARSTAFDSIVITCYNCRMKLELRRIGNSLGIIVPKEALRSLSKIRRRCPRAGRVGW